MNINEKNGTDLRRIRKKKEVVVGRYTHTHTQNRGMKDRFDIFRACVIHV